MEKKEKKTEKNEQIRKEEKKKKKEKKDTPQERVISKNEKALKICGPRLPLLGTPINSPWEVGFSCPICAPPVPQNMKDVFDPEGGDVKEIYERLDWSEYAGFCFCRNCNLDIPTYFCIARPIDRSHIEYHIEYYLKMIESLQERVKSDLPFNEQIFHQTLTENKELKEQIKALEMKAAMYNPKEIARLYRQHHKRFWRKQCWRCEGTGSIKTDDFYLCTCTVCNNKGYIPKWKKNKLNEKNKKTSRKKKKEKKRKRKREKSKNEKKIENKKNKRY